MRQGNTNPFAKMFKVQQSSMLLSDAILLGSVKHPQKIGGYLKVNEYAKLTETCAIVAAVDCVGILEEALKEGLNMIQDETNNQ